MSKLEELKIKVEKAERMQMLFENAFKRLDWEYEVLKNEDGETILDEYGLPTLLKGEEGSWGYERSVMDVENFEVVKKALKKVFDDMLK